MYGSIMSGPPALGGSRDTACGEAWTRDLEERGERGISPTLTSSLPVRRRRSNDTLDDDTAGRAKAQDDSADSCPLL